MLRNHVAQRSTMRLSHVTVLLIVVTSYVAADLAEEIVDLSQCRDSNRLGKSLQHVEPPASCISGPGDTGTTWCDTPGVDYPWQAIRAYLRRSSDDVTRRTGQLDPTDIEKLLNKYGVSKSPSVVKRLRRSADVTSDARDVTRQQLVREAGRVTSRGSATTVTEATNFELDGRPKDGSTSDKHGGRGGAKTKRINDKNLTEEDELVLLLTYFSNPNSIIFTESVLQGLMMMREASESDTGQLVEKEGSESEMKVQGETVVEQSGHSGSSVSEERLTQAELSGNANNAVLEETLERHNTSSGDRGANETLEPKEDSVSQNLINTETLEPYGVPSLTPTSSPVTTTQQSMPGSSVTSSSNSPSASGTSAVPSPASPVASPTVSPPPSTIPATSLFPDVHSRRPSPLRHPIHAESPPYGDLPMTSSSSDISTPGIRTGPQVLQQIQTGDDVLAEFSDRETLRPSTSGGTSQDQWSWGHQGSDVNSQAPQETAWDDGTWSDGSQASWGTKTDGHDVWGDEHFPPEVQYYRPTRPPPVEADPVDAFQWVDSPTPKWRPMRPSPQAESLVVLPPEKGDQKKDKFPQGQEKLPVRGGANTGGDGSMYEAERIVVGSKRRPTTRRPETVASLAEELEFIEETVYTEPIYRPNGEAEVSPTAAMTPATTEAPLTSSGTTADPYVMSACDVSVEVRSPYYAMNTQNVWKMLINIPPFETYIHMEHCVVEHEQGRCAAGCRCTQRHSIRTMPVYVRDSDGCDRIYMDKFLFPSHCDCMCLPTHHVLFNLTRPAPTTPVRPSGENGSSTFTQNVGGGSAEAESTSESVYLSGGSANYTFPPRYTDGASAEALKAAGFAARVVTAAPTLSPSSRRAPGSSFRTPPPRRPVVPADSLVRSHRNKNRGPAFSSPMRHRTSQNGVTRRNGRANDIQNENGIAEQMPPPLPRR